MPLLPLLPPAKAERPSAVYVVQDEIATLAALAVPQCAPVLRTAEITHRRCIIVAGNAPQQQVMHQSSGR